MRSGLYAGPFAAHAAGTWHGLWALLPLALSCVEIGVTARDTVVEFRLRSVDAPERIAHLLLLVNTGAYTMAIGLAVSEETGLARAGPDTAPALLALAAAVALASAARDARAAASRARLERSRT